MARKPRRLRRKKDKGAASGEQQRSPAGELKDALREMREGDQVARRRGWRERQHVDDYREVEVNEAPGELSGALLDLISDAHASRHRLLDDEEPTVRLPVGRKGAGPGSKAGQTEAKEAARELKEQMDLFGVPERTHYYTATERRQTGEVDRTYKLKKSERRERGRGRRRKRRSRKQSEA